MMEELQGTREEIEQVVETLNEPKKEAAPYQPTFSRSVMKKFKKQQKVYQSQVEKFKELQLVANLRENNELKEYRQRIGKESFDFLKKICTIDTPEQKNEQGEVTVPAKSELNKEALLKECYNVIIMLREERILAGKRKRSTGRRSKRQAHKNAIAFLNSRNNAAIEELKP